MFIPNENFRQLAGIEEEGEEGDEEGKNSARQQPESFSPSVAALKCLSATMQNKIISSENDRIGVVFYSTVH